MEVPAQGLPTRIDKLLVEQLEGVTRAEIQRWISEERVTCEGRVVRAKEKSRAGQRIEVRPLQEKKWTLEPDPSIELRCLYEDEHLLVVEKPAGLTVHPGPGNWEGTLVHALLAREGFHTAPWDSRDPEGYLRPGIVHRLDKDTSGILVVAKDELAMSGLKEQFAAHSIERVYQAITVGVPREGRIQTLHGRDPHSRLRFSSRVQQGKEAITQVQLLEGLAGAQAALVECRLETGRTHQIRVHLSLERNTPLLGDELYGGLRGPREVTAVGKQLGRQALHARVLGFVHPHTHKHLRFESELPADLEQALTQLRALV